MENNVFAVKSHKPMFLPSSLHWAKPMNNQKMGAEMIIIYKKYTVHNISKILVQLISRPAVHCSVVWCWLQTITRCLRMWGLWVEKEAQSPPSHTLSGSTVALHSMLQRNLKLNIWTLVPKLILKDGKTEYTIISDVISSPFDRIYNLLKLLCP